MNNASSNLFANKFDCNSPDSKAVLFLIEERLLFDNDTWTNKNNFDIFHDFNGLVDRTRSMFELVKLKGLPGTVEIQLCLNKFFKTISKSFNNKCSPFFFKTELVSVPFEFLNK